MDNPIVRFLLEGPDRILQQNENRRNTNLDFLKNMYNQEQENERTLAGFLFKQKMAMAEAPEKARKEQQEIAKNNLSTIQDLRKIGGEDFLKQHEEAVNMKKDLDDLISPETQTAMQLFEILYAKNNTLFNRAMNKMLNANMGEDLTNEYGIILNALKNDYRFYHTMTEDQISRIMQRVFAIKLESGTAIRNADLPPSVSTLKMVIDGKTSLLTTGTQPIVDNAASLYRNAYDRAKNTYNQVENYAQTALGDDHARFLQPYKERFEALAKPRKYIASRDSALEKIEKLRASGKISLEEFNMLADRIGTMSSAQIIQEFNSGIFDDDDENDDDDNINININDNNDNIPDIDIDESGNIIRNLPSINESGAAKEKISEIRKKNAERIDEIYGNYVNFAKGLDSAWDFAKNNPGKTAGGIGAAAYALYKLMKKQDTKSFDEFAKSFNNEIDTNPIKQGFKSSEKAGVLATIKQMAKYVGRKAASSTTLGLAGLSDAVTYGSIGGAAGGAVGGGLGAIIGTAVGGVAGLVSDVKTLIDLYDAFYGKTSETDKIMKDLDRVAEDELIKAMIEEDPRVKSMPREKQFEIAKETVRARYNRFLQQTPSTTLPTVEDMFSRDENLIKDNDIAIQDEVIERYRNLQEQSKKGTLTLSKLQGEITRFQQDLDRLPNRNAPDGARLVKILNYLHNDMTTQIAKKDNKFLAYHVRFVRKAPHVFKNFLKEKDSKFLAPHAGFVKKASNVFKNFLGKK